MLKQAQGAALMAVMQTLSPPSPDAQRVPLPGECEDDLLRASVILTAALSADGQTFVVRCYAGRADLGEDAQAEISEHGATIYLARLPATAVNTVPVQRFATVLMICARAYLSALLRAGWEVNLDTDEEPYRALARAAATAAPDLVAVALRRMCH